VRLSTLRYQGAGSKSASACSSVQGCRAAGGTVATRRLLFFVTLQALGCSLAIMPMGWALLPWACRLNRTPATHTHGALLHHTAHHTPNPCLKQDTFGAPTNVHRVKHSTGSGHAAQAACVMRLLHSYFGPLSLAHVYCGVQPAAQHATSRAHLGWQRGPQQPPVQPAGPTPAARCRRSPASTLQTFESMPSLRRCSCAGGRAVSAGVQYTLCSAAGWFKHFCCALHVKQWPHGGCVGEFNVNMGFD
jgi:hypothetical protein